MSKVGSQHMKSNHERKAAQRIAEDAARWMYTLERADEQQLDAFSEWLLQSPLHEKAFLDAVAVDKALGRIKLQPLPDSPGSSAVPTSSQLRDWDLPAPRVNSYEGRGSQKRAFPSPIDLMVATYSHVERFIDRRTPGSQPHNVQDLAQEVCLRLLRYRPNDPVESPIAYILKVAKNVMSDFAARHSKERDRLVFDEAQVSEYSNVAEDDSADPAQSTANQQELSWLTRGLLPMPLAVLTLCKRDGLSYKEAGTALGISPDTVKKHLAQAIAHCAVRANRLGAREAPRWISVSSDKASNNSRRSPHPTGVRLGN